MKKMILIGSLALVASSCFSVKTVAADKQVESGVLLLTFADRHPNDRFYAEWEAALPIFKKYNAHATFFFNGKFNDKIAKSLQKIAADGHSAGAQGIQIIRNFPEEVRTKGKRTVLESFLMTQCAEAEKYGASFNSFFYPSLARTEASDAALLTRFKRLVVDNGIRPFGISTNDVKALATDERMFFPSKDLPNRAILSGVKLGEACRTDVDDLLACVRRAAERKEVVMFYAHGIKAGVTDQHMSIDWLERILAEAKKCGVRVMGLDELPAVAIPDEKKFYSATLPKNVKTIDVGVAASVKTLEGALAKVAEIRAKDKKTPLAVRVASGDYALSAPLEITKAHASPAMGPLFIYADDFKNKPRLNGGWPWQVTNDVAVVKVMDGGNFTLAGFDLTGSGDGVRIENSSRVKILGCDIRSIGGSGIVVDAKDAKDSKEILIENNHIFDVGRSNASSVGIRLVQNVTGVRVRQNFIHDVPSHAISGFGRACEISYNRIGRVNTKAPNTGVIDHLERTASDSRIQYNWISDIRTEGVCGIRAGYTGEGLFIVGNLIEKCRAAAVLIERSRNILVSNNVFVSCGPVPASSNAVQYVVKDTTSGVKTVNNIFYYPEQAKGYYLQATHINIRANIFANNIVWSGTTAFPRVLTERASLSWKEWRGSYVDDKSLVAYAMFRAPMWGNYRLYDESVAFNRGFTEIPYDEIGLQESLVRPVLPKGIDLR